MRVSINAGVVTIVGSLKEEHIIEKIRIIMFSEFSSMCLMEFFGAKTGHEIVETTFANSDSEATVQTVKESYSDAKRATK